MISIFRTAAACLFVSMLCLDTARSQSTVDVDGVFIGSVLHDAVSRFSGAVPAGRISQEQRNFQFKGTLGQSYSIDAFHTLTFRQDWPDGKVDLRNLAFTSSVHRYQLFQITRELTFPRTAQPTKSDVWRALNEKYGDPSALYSRYNGNGVGWVLDANMKAIPIGPNSLNPHGTLPPQHPANCLLFAFPYQGESASHSNADILNFGYTNHRVDNLWHCRIVILATLFPGMTSDLVSKLTMTVIDFNLLRDGNKMVRDVIDQQLQQSHREFAPGPRPRL
ncbi:hypothetical protein GJW-30_1_01801 [Variibacter gotjawalensis]|uniref:Uncharacterized protein n=1 Tax=Variibacter gotjawalensis TaxID=1333996 RepID=A0A0S3PTJ4_9BRAD|nr:hypothetical protein [Variibacter gotjawalensis]NIK49586.1 hypothetical protein [Variibacter gotjawalensis]RZS45597.1 hypothetical protein EV661_3916 [Variibacter gotjawalensis]BAT59270.1 hypothetical protein GJW-30_1_01801 [Variibacter gotjawalensis]